MAPQLWIRNPRLCIREVIECGERNIVFDAGFAAKRKFDPAKFLQLYYENVGDYEFMIIQESGTEHYLSDFPDAPIGIYPTWNASEDSVSILREWLERPVCDDEELCSDKTIPKKIRPLYKQQHRIIIHKVPDLRTQVGKQVLMLIHDLQIEYPDVRFFVHGLNTLSVPINLEFPDFDIEPRGNAATGQIYLPSGKRARDHADIIKHQRWVHLVGFSVEQLKIPRERCMFNIRAARWACNNGMKPKALATRARPEMDIDTRSSDLSANLPTTKRTLSSVAAISTDKIHCDTCSLSRTCMFYREGMVCNLPGSEMNSVSSMFQTRDTDKILDGLSRLAAMQAKRAETAMSYEEDFGLDKDTSKLLNDAFTMGERFAKLNDPRLRANINVNENRTRNGSVVEVTVLDPGVAATNAIEFFAEMGFEASAITPAMMKGYLRKVAGLNEIEAGPGSEESEPVEPTEVLNND